MGTLPLEVGSVFANDYRVERLLADGGMGSVYVAEQLSTGKRRALKVMHPRMLHDPSLRERFTQEARLGAKIASDHVVEVVGAGLDAATGIPWMAMELLRGRDLSAALEEHGAYALGEAQSMLRQAGHALSRAHALGIVHRDLKPENLFLAEARSEGAGLTVKILDFGIAKVMQETRATGATLGGLGTPLWMAPEQTHGGTITPATDVWALGLIGFALLAGRSYWKSAGQDVSLQVVLGEMVLAPMPAASARVAEFGLPVTLPPGFDAWFAQCVARNASERFVSAEPCMAAFLALRELAPTRAFAAPTQLGAPSVPAPPRSAPRSAPRRGWVPAVLAAAVLVPALGLGAWVATRPSTPRVAERVAPTPVRASLAESLPTHEHPVVAPRSAPTPAVERPTPAAPAAVVRRPAVVARRPVVAPVRPAPPSVPAYSAVREPPAPAYVPPPPVAAPEPEVQPTFPMPDPPRRWGRRRWSPRPEYPPATPDDPTTEAAPVQPAQPALAPPRAACGACTQGATERCNGCDDNCNGAVDEGC